MFSPKLKALYSVVAITADSDSANLRILGALTNLPYWKMPMYELNPKVAQAERSLRLEGGRGRAIWAAMGVSEFWEEQRKSHADLILC